jgi:RNA polymerase sigma-70 factor (ECF subfamily)
MKAAAALSAFASGVHDSWTGGGGESGDLEGNDASEEDDDVTRSAPRERSEGIALPSFDEVYDRHLTFVWRSLRALGIPPHQLDDAVQDVFVVVHRRLCTFEGRAKMTSWLFGVAMRVARNYRRGRPSDDLDEVQEQLLDGQPSPFEATARSEAVLLLERFLETLDEKKRIVFVLMDIEQMTAEEVAQMIGVNVNTVYSRRRFARIEFERLVAEHGTSA